MNRVFTVTLVMKDEASAKEFWDAHRARRTIHGCMVQALADGDKIKEAEHLQETLEEIDSSLFDDDHEELEII